MKHLLFLDQHELGYTHANDRSIDFRRKAARCVVRDEAGHIALMYFARDQFYKLPGGGIDEGEDLLDALAREVQEEAGLEIDDIEQLGIVEENRYYCGMHQLSYCYRARAARETDFARTDEEAAAGMELRWVDDIETAVALIRDSEGHDEEGNSIGLKIMKLREIAILEAAK